MLLLLSSSSSMGAKHPLRRFCEAQAAHSAASMLGVSNGFSLSRSPWKPVHWG